MKRVPWLMGNSPILKDISLIAKFFNYIEARRLSFAKVKGIMKVSY